MNRIIETLWILLFLASCESKVGKPKSHLKLEDNDSADRKVITFTNTQIISSISFKDKLLDSIKSAKIILSKINVIKHENVDSLKKGFAAFSSKKIIYNILKIQTIEILYLKFASKAKKDLVHLSETVVLDGYLNDCIVKLVRFKTCNDASSFFTTNYELLNPKQWPLQLSVLKSDFVVLISSKNDQITEEVKQIRDIVNSITY